MSDTVDIDWMHNSGVRGTKSVPCHGRYGNLCVAMTGREDGVDWYAMTHIPTGLRFGPMFHELEPTQKCVQHLLATLGAEFFDSDNATDGKPRPNKKTTVADLSRPFIDMQRDFKDEDSSQ